MTLELLLAHADDARPVLRHGLTLDALRGAPRPVPLPALGKLWSETADRNLLPKQRWGLVAPEGQEGDCLLKLIEPLRCKRQEDQGGHSVLEFRVPPRLDGQSALRWKKRIFREQVVSEEDRPRYLLLLGDLEQVSHEAQQILSSEAYVGRLAFSSHEGYTAYVNKVLRWEARAGEARPRLLFYTARDGSEATSLGHRLLVEPGIDACRQQLRKGGLSNAEVHEIDDEEGRPGELLLASAAEPRPSVLFSMSHGQGRPIRGWGSPAQQREHQGTLLLPDGRRLIGADVASRPFLPGGFWFCFACFSAGTPARSNYEPWLRQLSETDESARQAFASLPHREERPFIAALPQAVLANPNGPLAVVGHVDLAWSYSFSDQGRGTPERFVGILKSLTEGSRAGPALSHLLRYLNEANNSLVTLHAQEEAARAAGGSSVVNPHALAELWMRRQDLAGYMLLGDPAVRLPLAR